MISSSRLLPLVGLASAAACATSSSGTSRVDAAASTPLTSSRHDIDMAAIEGGTLHVGGDSAQTVNVSPFFLDRLLVTVTAYATCVHAAACIAPGNEQRGTPGAGPEQNALCNGSHADRGDQPVNCVDWSQASTYCAWAGKRLPTEEEWEWAARGPEGRAYPWGATEPESQACWKRLQGDDYAHAAGTCPVGSHPRGDTPAGVHDLSGNVWEWTSSPWTVPYGGTRDPSAHAIRGGGWRDADPKELRGVNRNGSDATDRVINMGFRCAKSGT